MAMNIQQLMQMAQAAGVGGPVGGASPGMIDPDQNAMMNQAAGRFMPPPGVMPAPGGSPMAMAVAAKMKAPQGTWNNPVPSYAPVPRLAPNENDQPQGPYGNPTNRDIANMQVGTDGALTGFEQQFGVPASVGPGGMVNGPTGYERGADGQLLNANVSKRNANKAGVPNGAMLDSDVMSDDAYVPTGRERRGGGPYVRTSSGGPETDEEELADIQNRMGGVQGPDKKRRFNKTPDNDDDYEGDDRK